MRNWGPQHLADAERLHVVDFCSRIAASEHVMETHFGASKLSGQACFSWRISGRTPLPLQVRESPSSGVTLDSGSGAGFLESWCRYHVETMLKLALALSSSQRGCWCGPLCTPFAVATNACTLLLVSWGAGHGASVALHSCAWSLSGHTHIPSFAAPALRQVSGRTLFPW